MKYMNCIKKVLILILVLSVFLILTGCGKYDYGLVKDTEGNPVADATVEIGERTLQTNENGYFSISGLTPGTYDLKIRKEGYKDK